MGDSIMRNYLENPEADAKNYFFLTMPGDAWDATPRHSRYFLTGDVGVLDSEGFLSLKGRAKVTKTVRVKRTYFLEKSAHPITPMYFTF